MLPGSADLNFVELRREKKNPHAASGSRGFVFEEKKMSQGGGRGGRRRERRLSPSLQSGWRKRKETSPPPVLRVARGLRSAVPAAADNRSGGAPELGIPQKPGEECAQLTTEGDGRIGRAGSPSDRSSGAVAAGEASRHRWRSSRPRGSPARHGTGSGSVRASCVCWRTGGDDRRKSHQIVVTPR